MGVGVSGVRGGWAETETDRDERERERALYWEEHRDKRRLSEQTRYSRLKQYNDHITPGISCDQAIFFSCSRFQQVRFLHARVLASATPLDGIFSDWCCHPVVIISVGTTRTIAMVAAQRLRLLSRC